MSWTESTDEFIGFAFYIWPNVQMIINSRLLFLLLLLGDMDDVTETWDVGWEDRLQAVDEWLLPSCVGGCQSQFRAWSSTRFKWTGQSSETRSAQCSGVTAQLIRPHSELVWATRDCYHLPTLISIEIITITSVGKRGIDEGFIWLVWRYSTG